jgi:hypothetical protein
MSARALAGRTQDGASRHAVAPGAIAHRGPSFYDRVSYGGSMPVRLRKMIGMIMLVVLVIVYAIVATLVAVAQLAESSPWVHLGYFFLTGLLWVLPAMLIIKWMARPEA